MKLVYADTNRLNIEAAFSNQAALFDDLYSQNAIVNYKRKRVREHLLKFMTPDSSVLELNCGTGEDAVYLALNGHRVHATDVSLGMQERLRAKVDQRGLKTFISTELCSFTQLNALQNRGPFDHIFSNFGGLNCTQDLDRVLQSFSGLLKTNGIVTLVIIPKFCLWEALLIFKGKFKTATRRWFSKKGAQAHIDGTYFKCWYYNPSYVIKHMGSSFQLLEIEGLCTVVPPSYIENFAEKYPRIYKYLESKEDHLRNKFPWKYCGDYFIISLKKK
jgi:ubiquinone/menaquinone biosynthesis C-methylase UbiE